MTVQEANTERLTSIDKQYARGMICRYEDCDVSEEHCPHLMEADCECLKEVIKKLAEYEDLGTVEELKEAREKQIPYKPEEYEDRYYACKCDNILLPKWKKYPTELMPKGEGLPRCMACGQKLDWEEE